MFIKIEGLSWSETEKLMERYKSLHDNNYITRTYGGQRDFTIKQYQCGKAEMERIYQELLGLKEAGQFGNVSINLHKY